MTDLLTTEAITALFQVVMIDLVLAGDNAIVIGLAAAGLPQEQRTKAILVGIVAATALRILFASVTTQLLKLVGLLFAGGLILLWVCWKMWRELRTSAEEGREATEALIGYDTNADGTIAALGQFLRAYFCVDSGVCPQSPQNPCAVRIVIIGSRQVQRRACADFRHPALRLASP
jgi:predicted tellurium resistance membrane protein TerC